MVGVGSKSAGSWSHLKSIEIGSVSAENKLVLVQDLGHLGAPDVHIRGILGGNLLEQFNLFIDYEHPLLCLDSSEAMGHALKGKHTEIVAVPHVKEEAVFSTPLIIRVHCPGQDPHDLLLLLDSGTNAPVLYETNRALTIESNKARGIDGADRAFSLLPASDLQIEGNWLRNISFITPTSVAADVPQVPFDGLLPTSVFKQIFISYSGRYVEIDPQ